MMYVLLLYHANVLMLFRYYFQFLYKFSAFKKYWEIRTNEIGLLFMKK